MERTIGGFRGFTWRLDSAKEKGIINVTGAWNKGDVKSSQGIKQSYEMGKGV